MLHSLRALLVDKYKPEDAVVADPVSVVIRVLLTIPYVILDTVSQR